MVGLSAAIASVLDVPPPTPSIRPRRLARGPHRRSGVGLLLALLTLRLSLVENGGKSNDQIGKSQDEGVAFLLV
jgi:hypothetical protein